MTRSPPPAQLVESLKRDFAERFACQTSLPTVRSVFLIGSSAGTAEHNDWYQDFDVHLLLDDGAIPSEQLDEIRTRLDGLIGQYERLGARIAWDVRDRHWKLVPDKSAGVNLSVHATLANRFDFQRRALHHRVLGWNMYAQAEVLAGDHPTTIIPIAPSEPLQHLFSVGGVGWMIENFYRAVWLLLSEPERQTFYPYIGGYCWNVASSLMLQHYSLSTGCVTTRLGALDHLVREHALSSERQEDVEFLLSHKLNTATTSEEARALVNATARVAAALSARALDRLGVPRPASKNDIVFRDGDHFSTEFSAALGRRIVVREIYCWLEPGEAHFLDAFEELVRHVGDRYRGVSPLEHFEALERAADDGAEELTKVSVWSPWNAARLSMSCDFARYHGCASVDGALWGWETGTQALLQRLHELYLRRGDGDTERELARAAVYVASRQHEDVGFASLGEPGHRVVDCAQQLATALEPYRIPLR